MQVKQILKVSILNSFAVLHFSVLIINSQWNGGTVCWCKKIVCNYISLLQVDTCIKYCHFFLYCSLISSLVEWLLGNSLFIYRITETYITELLSLCIPHISSHYRKMELSFRVSSLIVDCLHTPKNQWLNTRRWNM